jgi:ankyrin repeat protein
MSLNLLLKSGANPLITDNNGNNVLHLALQNNNIDIIKFLIDKIPLNFLTNNNETILQLALSYGRYDIFTLLIKKKINLNNQEKEYGLAIIHQSIINNNPTITKLIIDNGADINLQDYHGNTALIYSINDVLIEQINILILCSELNYNLTNINGNTGLHIILENIDNFPENIIKIFIENTNLNIQNNDGNTCLHLLNKDLLKKYENIFEKKELNIFIKNNNNKTPDVNNINIIVNSYYNSLLKHKNNLVLDWEKECDKNNNEIKCKEKIKETINKEHRSIPKYNDSDLIFDSGIFVNVCYYTGASIDILFGLLYLYQEFNYINLIIDYPLTHNTELENYFKSLGINYNYKLDFCNFEINWSFQKIIYPTYFDYEIKNKIKNNSYIIIPIGIETVIGSHANILFYDVKNKIIERFDPSGAYEPKNLNYNAELLDNILEKKFKEFDDITFIRPKDYLPTIGLQILENIEEYKSKRIGDPNGFCGVWCIWWIYHKLKNINIDSKTLIDKLIKEIKFQNMSFKNVIRNFSKNISDLRDTFLQKYNSDINDFIIGNYTNELLIKLEKDIINFIIR